MAGAIIGAAKTNCASSGNRRVRETYASLLLNYCIALRGNEAVCPVVKSAIELVLSGEKEEEVSARKISRFLLPKKANKGMWNLSSLFRRVLFFGPSSTPPLRMHGFVCAYMCISRFCTER